MSVPRSLQLPPTVSRTEAGSALPLGPLAALRGEADPPPRAPVLCVPGFTGSKEDFLPLLPLLGGAGHPCLSIDLRGQFESVGPDEPTAYEIPALAGEVTAVVHEMSETCAGAGVHLVGHSFGGLVCRAVALAGRAPLASLTLLGSGPGAIPPPTADLLTLMEPVLADGGVAAVWEASKQVNGEPEAPAEVADFLERRFLATHPVGLAVMGRQLRSEPDRTAELAGVGLPLLVVHGAADDQWPPAVQAEMARRLSAQHAAIPGAEHSPAVESPERTAQVLTRFFAGVEGR